MICGVDRAAMHGEDVVVRILPSTMLFDLGIWFLGRASEHSEGPDRAAARDPVRDGPDGQRKDNDALCMSEPPEQPHAKIITIEDPVEYELDNVVQTQIQPQIGLTFARALRSMLRHDPDVMMIGEVRDRETAEIAVQTAMTGTWCSARCTRTTRQAGGAADRHGIDPYLITSTVLGSSRNGWFGRSAGVQGAVRVERGDGVSGKGCRLCNGSGFRGRIAVSEFFLWCRRFSA